MKLYTADRPLASLRGAIPILAAPRRKPGPIFQRLRRGQVDPGLRREAFHSDATTSSARELSTQSANGTVRLRKPVASNARRN